MGANQRDNIDIDPRKIKNEASNKRGVMDDEATEEYINKAKYSTCYISIEKEHKHGSGFFCKIPFTENENILLNVLITCWHVLGEDIVFSDENIILIVNNCEKTISLKKERKRWTNKEMDYSCIEILEEDGIEDYYRLDDIFNSHNANKNYINKNIIIFCIMNNKRGHCDGLIKKVDKFMFVHTCNTYEGSSGGAIVNKNNNLVIGLHKGELKYPKKIINVGIFIKNIIEDIISKNKKGENINNFLDNKISINKEEENVNDYNYD